MCLIDRFTQAFGNAYCASREDYGPSSMRLGKEFLKHQKGARFCPPTQPSKRVRWPQAPYSSRYTLQHSIYDAVLNRAANGRGRRDEPAACPGKPFQSSELRLVHFKL